MAGKLGKKGGLAIGAGLGVGLAAAGAGKVLFGIGEQFDKAFDTIRVGTGKTGKDLKGLEGDFKSVFKSLPVSMDDTAAAVTGLNQRLGITGKPLQRLSKQILQLSRITKTDVGTNVAAITRLFGDWSVKTRAQSGTLDKLFRLTQRTGIGLGDLSRLMVKFGSPLRSLGFDFDSAAAMFGRFEREGVNLQTTLPGFKIALKNFAKPTTELAAKFKQFGVDADVPQKALKRIFELLKSLPKGEATALAFEVFGSRAATDMMRAVKEGRFEFDELIASMNRGGETINKAEKDTRDFGEQWQMLKNRIFVGLEPIASRFFKTVGDGMEALATADFSQIAADIGFGEVDTSGIRASAADIRDIVQDLGPVWDFMGDVAKRQIQAVAQVFRAMGQTIRGVTKLISGILSGDFGKAWSGVKDIFGGGVRTSLGLLRGMSAPVREIAARVGSGLSSAFRGAWRTVRNVFESGAGFAMRTLRSMASGAGDIGERVGRLIAHGFRARLNLIRGVANDVVGIITRIPSRLGNIGSAILDAIKSGLSGRTIIPKIDPPGPGSFPGIKVPKFATGGKAQGWAVVGEEGPELAHFSQPTDIVSHPLSKKLVRDVPGFARGTVTPSEVTAIAQKWGVNRAVASIGAAVDDRFPAMEIMSGFREGSRTPSGSISNHARRAALDLGSKGSLNRRIGAWVRSQFSEAIRKVTEGVLDVDHDPNPPDHADHVHVAAVGAKALAKVMQEGADGDGPTRLTGKLSLGQMVTLAKRVGFPDPALAAAIGYAESRGQIAAAGDGGDSLGLWQINTPAHPNFDKGKLRNDAFYNARAALAISRKGRNWGPWTQFRTGAYKQFLGGRATPLPKGEGASAGGQGSSYADFLALRLQEAEATSGQKDDLKWINRGLRYWRGVYRRNKQAGNWQRAADAFSQVTGLREKKKELRAKPDESVFTLGGLSKIGKVNVAGLQGTLDAIELESAKAALTETLDVQGNVTPASYDDDLKAASRLVTIWGDLFKLASEGWKGISGPGTRAQQTEAATNLKSALDAKKSIEDEQRQETGSTAEAPDTSARDSQLADLWKQIAEASQKQLAVAQAQMPIFEQFKNAPRFDQGGIMPGSPQKHYPAWVAGGEEVRRPGHEQSFGVFFDEGAIVGGEVDESKIRAVAWDAMTERDREIVRKARSGGPAPGRKLVFPR